MNRRQLLFAGTLILSAVCLSSWICNAAKEPLTKAERAKAWALISSSALRVPPDAQIVSYYEGERDMHLKSAVVSFRCNTRIKDARIKLMPPGFLEGMREEMPAMRRSAGMTFGGYPDIVAYLSGSWKIRDLEYRVSIYRTKQEDLVHLDWVKS